MGLILAALPALIAAPLPVGHLIYEVVERVGMGKLGDRTVEDMTEKVKRLRELETKETVLILGGAVQVLVLFVVCRVMQWTFFPVVGIVVSLGYVLATYGLKRWTAGSLNEERTKLYKLFVQRVKAEWNAYKREHPQLFTALDGVKLKPTKEMVTIDRGSEAEAVQAEAEVATEESVHAFTLEGTFKIADSKNISPAQRSLSELRKRIELLYRKESITTDSITTDKDRVVDVLWDLNVRSKKPFRGPSIIPANISETTLGDIVHSFHNIEYLINRAAGSLDSKKRGSSVAGLGMDFAKREPKHAIAILFEHYRNLEASITEAENHTPVFLAE